MASVLLQAIIAWAYSHVAEYFAHKMLHHYGRKRDSLFAFHWRTHHRTARQNLMYARPSVREILYLSGFLLAHSPLYLVAPWAFGMLVFCSLSYLYHHWRSHMDTAWAVERLPWHVEHHMGNQHKNWGVRSDLLDRLFGTASSS